MAKDTSGLSLEDLILALKAATGNDDEALKKRAEYEAEAHARRMNKRENEHGTGISVFNPKGGMRSALKCDMFWVGYPLEVDNLSEAEIAVLNQAVEGEFSFTRTDGTREKLSVKATYGNDRDLRKLEFFFPCQGLMKHNLPGKTPMLSEAFGLKTPEQDELDRLRAAVASLPVAV